MNKSGAPAETDPIAELLSRTALRDRTAFAELFDATSPKLFAVLIRLLGRGDAEDALQDVFVKVWNNASKFRGGTGSGIGWLLTLTRHHAIDLIRARGPATEDIANRHDLTSSDLTPEQAVAASLNRARLDRCLKQLDADRAEAVRRAYLDGETYAELAERFSVPLNTMRTWLRRSLISLKSCLSGADGEQVDG